MNELIFENGLFRDKSFSADSNCNSIDVNLIIRDDILLDDRSEIISKLITFHK